MPELWQRRRSATDMSWVTLPETCRRCCSSRLCFGSCHRSKKPSTSPHRDCPVTSAKAATQHRGFCLGQHAVVTDDRSGGPHVLCRSTSSDGCSVLIHGSAGHWPDPSRLLHHAAGYDLHVSNRSRRRIFAWRVPACGPRTHRPLGSHRSPWTAAIAIAAALSATCHAASALHNRNWPEIHGTALPAHRSP